MKKIIIWVIAIIAVIFIIVGTMFAFTLCPPKGPWPMPAWCIEYQRNNYENKYLAQHLNIIPAVNMADTWGRNYNFLMSGVTWNNIESSFDRLNELGAKEVYINDFHLAKYSGKADFASTDYEIVDDTFWNDFRDEGIKQKHLNKLAEQAHKRGMKIGYKNNIAFVNIRKYILSGNIASEVNSDYQNFNKQHTDEWVKDFFSKWKKRMLDKAEMLNEAGFDIMSVTPTWMGPEYRNNEKLANELWKDLITAVKQKFKGKVHVMVDKYGFLSDESKADTEYEDFKYYDYYKNADIVEIDFYNLLENYRTANSNPTIQEMKQKFDSMLEDTNKKAVEKNIKVSVFISLFSYPDAVNMGIVEFHDFQKEDIKSLKSDFSHQADAYQAFFESINDNKEKQNIERIIIGGYWWDDAIDPQVQVRVSIAPSPRNKPAEEVIKAWFKE